MSRHRGASLVRANALHIPLADASVDLIVTSPPYWALRSYQDDGGHYAGQIGSEPTPVDFLRALWAVADECWRVLKPSGSMFVNLGDKYAGSGGHNNAGLATSGSLAGSTLQGSNGGMRAKREADRCIKATLRSAPDRYNQAADVRAKSLMGLPWRFALGLMNPDVYRGPLVPPDCWHGDQPCTVCRPVGHPQWIARRDLIWHKLNGLPEAVTDRCRTSHEYWFHLTKEPRYFAAVDEVRETQTVSVGGRDTRTPRSSSGGTNHRALRNDRDQYNPLGKLPGSVWSIPSEPLIVPEHLGVDHFAAFPTECPRRLILGWSPSGICTACREGRRPVVDSKAVESPVHADGSIMGNRNGGPDERGWDGLPRFNREHTITGYACGCPDTSAPTRPAVVLDPFAGTGTVPMVARTLGRYGLGLDLSRDYLRLATWRIWESGHGRKAEARTNRERQGALFGGAA